MEGAPEQMHHVHPVDAPTSGVPVSDTPCFPEWQNPKWVTKEHKQILVDVKLPGDDSWCSYCVDPQDIYCSFGACSFFEFLVSTGQVAEPVEQSLEEKRAGWALPRLDLKMMLAEKELLDKVDDNIGSQSQKLRLEWREGAVVKRVSELSTKIMEWTGLGEEQYDELFSGKI